jgi:hypothetical protein
MPYEEIQDFDYIPSKKQEHYEKEFKQEHVEYVEEKLEKGGLKSGKPKRQVAI